MEILSDILVNGVCPKCGERSGDSWSQCGRACPIPGSPFYVRGMTKQQITEALNDEAERDRIMWENGDMEEDIPL